MVWNGSGPVYGGGGGGGGIRPTIRDLSGTQFNVRNPPPTYHPAVVPGNSNPSYGYGGGGSYRAPIYPAPRHTDVHIHHHTPRPYYGGYYPSYDYSSHGGHDYTYYRGGSSLAAFIVFAILFAVIVSAAVPEFLPAMIVIGAIAGVVGLVACAARSIRST